MKYLDNLNPALKALTIVTCSVITAFSYSYRYHLAMFTLTLILLLFFSGAPRERLFKILLGGSTAALAIFITGLLHTRGDGRYITYLGMRMSYPGLLNGLQMSLRTLNFLGLGVLFSLTSKPRTFMDSLLHQGKLSPKFAFGIMAALNTLPMMVEEYNQSKLALRARGEYVGVFSTKPIFAMLVNCIRWSESLSLAMISKGFSDDRDRTHYNITTIDKRDYLFMFGLIGTYLVTLIVL